MGFVSKVLLVLTLFFGYLSLAKSTDVVQYANKDLYLIDSLILDDLPLSDRQLVDSCLTIFHSSVHDTIKLSALGAITNEMVHHDWIKYQRKQMELLSQSLKDYPSGKVHLTLKKFLSEALNNLGIMYMDQGDIQASYGCNIRSLKISLEIKNWFGIAKSLNNIGGNFDAMGNVSKALEYYQKSIFFHQKVNNKFGEAASLNNIGQIYVSLGDFDKAIEYFEKSLAVNEKLDQKKVKASSLGNLGLAYFKKGYPNKALSYFLSSLLLNEETGNLDGKAENLNNIGFVYQLEGNFSEALAHFKKAYDINIYTDNQMKVSKSLIHIGYAYQNLNKWDSSIVFLEKGLAISTQMGLVEYQMKAACYLSHVYEKLGKESEALKMQRLCNQITDSLKGNHALRKFETTNFITELNEKEQQISTLHQEKKSTIEKYRGIFIVFLFCICLAIVLIRFWIRRKKRQFEKELTQLRELTSKSEINPSDSEKEIKTIAVTLGKKIKMIEVNDISYFYAKDKFVFLVTRDGKSHIIDHTIRYLVDLLPPFFVRIHRAYIINSNRVEQIIKANDRKFVFIMKGLPEQKVISSRGYLEQVKKIIEGNS